MEVTFYEHPRPPPKWKWPSMHISGHRQNGSGLLCTFPVTAKMEVTFYEHPRSPPKWKRLPQRRDAAPDSPERLVPGDLSRHQFCDFPPIQGDHRFLPFVVDLNRRDPSGDSRRHSGPGRKPEGLQEFSPGMSEARAIPWVSGPAARGSEASVSSEPQSRQQRL